MRIWTKLVFSNFSPHCGVIWGRGLMSEVVNIVEVDNYYLIVPYVEYGITIFISYEIEIQKKKRYFRSQGPGCSPV